MSDLIRNIAVSGLILAFLVPSVGYTVNLFLGLDGTSVTEKRRLAALPAYEGDARAYTTALDDYLEDHFAFRMTLIRVARKIRDNLGENPENVAYGKDGWLFLGQNEYRDEFEGNGLWDETQVDDWIASLTEVNEALAARNIPFAGFIAIDKARAYPEKLPDDWTESPRRFRSAVYAHPDIYGTGLIDAEPLVMSAKDRGHLVFFLRDTHWTAAGTYDLALEILKKLDPNQERLIYIPEPAVEQRASRVYDLDAMAGFETTQEPPYTMIKYPPSRPKIRTVMHRDEKGTPVRGRVVTLMILGTEDASEGRLVIVGDSFGDSMLGHLRRSYSEIVRIHHGAHFFDVDLDEVLSYEPDAVLFATAERQAARKARPFLPVTPKTP